MSTATIICPRCGNPMILRETAKYRYRNGDPRKFYGCSAWPDCDATCGAHPDGSPSSIPADDETKAARIRAHAMFDLFWQSGQMSRKEAYGWLQSAMGLSKEEAHIGMFDKSKCERLIEILSVERESGRSPS